MNILRIVAFIVPFFFVIKTLVLSYKVAEAQTIIEVLDKVTDPELRRIKREQEMTRTVTEIESIRDEYIFAYPEDKPKIAKILIDKTVDAPLIALPETLRDSVFALRLGAEIRKLPKTIHKPTYENTAPVLPVQIP